MASRTQPKIIRLTDVEKRHLADGASQIRYPESGSYESYVDQSRDIVSGAISPATLQQLRALQAGHSRGPLVIENLPFDSRVTRGLLDPETNLAGKPNDLSETLLVGTVACIGEPYAILQEGKGLVSHLSPKRSHLMGNTGLGALLDLGAHIENAGARRLQGDRAPDGLALIGVSADPIHSPGTVVASGLAALERISAKSLAILEAPDRFRIRFPERWRASGFPESLMTPIVLHCDGATSFVAAFYGDMTVALDDEAAEAITEFRSAIEACAIDVQIVPGTLVLLDNHTVFHGRRAFNPSFDGDGRPFRLVQRLFWTSSLERFGHWPLERGRLVRPTYNAH